MNGNLARSILCSVMTSVDFGWYSSIVGVCCFSCGACSCCVVAKRGQTMSAANMATQMMEKRVMVRREFIVPLGFLKVRLIFPQEGGPAPRNPLLEFAVMPQRGLFHFILLAGLGLAEDSDRKSTRLNSSHVAISYAVFCLKKKKVDETGETHIS